MAQLKFLGVPVYMNGQNYYIPSLATKDFREHEATLSEVVAGETVVAMFDRFIPIIGLAIRRNYPEVTNENLEDWLDLHTFKLAIKAVQDASGMEPVSAGE
jgi:hypothetical protein